MNWITLKGYQTKYQVLKQGKDTSPAVKKKSTVTVHAKGTVIQTGKVFWCTKDTNSPFTYEAGVGGVITGWDQGCLGMRVGEVRKINIPAKEGYGVGGYPAWGIPKNGDLMFEIEILKIA